MVCSKNCKDLKDKPELTPAVEHEGGQSQLLSVASGLALGRTRYLPRDRPRDPCQGKNLGKTPVGRVEVTLNEIKCLTGTSSSSLFLIKSILSHLGS